MVVLAAALLPAVVLAASATQRHPARAFHIHNPTGAAVTEVHMVQSSHFDGGCKTFGCTATLAAGEPDRCAQRHAEPYAYHIVNRWLDDYFLEAVALANATRAGTGLPRYRHMAQPWLLALLLGLSLIADIAANGRCGRLGHGAAGEHQGSRDGDRRCARQASVTFGVPDHGLHPP